MRSMIAQITGLDVKTAELAYHGTMKAIGAYLAQGKVVHLRYLGELQWRRRGPRTIPKRMLHGKAVPATFQEETFTPKFKPSQALKTQLKGVRPPVFIRNKTPGWAANRERYRQP